MNPRSLPEDDELVHLKRKAELAKCIGEQEEERETTSSFASTFVTFHLPIFINRVLFEGKTFV